MTRRAKCDGGLQAGEFLIGTFGISENNSSPCKQRRKQFSNRDKNGISELEPYTKMEKGRLKIAEPFPLFEFPIS
jgi:hypothetical protein